MLVDPDPELRRAMTTALQPWKLEVIVDTTPVEDPAVRADAMRARFVVWRTGKDLVVFDRERGDVQHRDVASGALDAVDAASAALSVKTLMRLPPPDEIERPPAEVATASGIELRVQAGAATRLSSQTSGRFVGLVMVRLIYELRVGVLGDIGTDDEFKEASFTGTWRDRSVLATASWTFPVRRFEIEPWIAAGITRSRVSAAPMGMKKDPMAIDDGETLPALRAGASLRYRIGRWTAGASAGVEGTAGTPTYTRDAAGKPLYEVPGLAVTLGAVIAADLGR